MENAELEKAVRARLAAAEEEIRGCLKSAASDMDIYRRPHPGEEDNLHLAVINLAWIAKEVGECARLAEQAYAVRLALLNVLKTAGDASAVEEDVEED